MRPHFYCIDHKDVIISNNFQSADSQSLEISFEIPEELCKDGDEDIECITDYQYNLDSANKYIVVLQNEHRFE